MNMNRATRQQNAEMLGRACRSRRDSVTNRWWKLYENDAGCKVMFNGLYLISALYGNDGDASEQSIHFNQGGQLEALESSNTEHHFKAMLGGLYGLCKQYPEGFFAHLQSQLPDIRVISGIRERVQIFAYGGTRLQTWEEWARNIIMMDDEAKADQMNVRIGGKKLRKILTEHQRTELEEQLEALHGERHYILGKGWVTLAGGMTYQYCVKREVN